MGGMVVQKEFNSMMVSVPIDYEHWLTNYYGADWQIPRCGLANHNGLKYFMQFVSNNTFWFHSYASFAVYYIFVIHFFAVLFAANSFHIELASEKDKVSNDELLSL